MNVNKMFGTLKLYQDAPNKKLLTLTVGVFKGLVRLYVNRSNTDFSEREFLFTIALTPINARLISLELNKLHKSKEESKLEVKLFGAKFNDETNQRVEGERSPTGSIRIAKLKNKDGVLVNVIQIVNKTDRELTFTLKPTPYIDIYRNDKKIVDETALSDLWTEAYAETFKMVLTNIPEAREVEKKVTF